jgi:hypothetical protein
LNATKPCDDRLEAVVALVMGELDAAADAELNEHLARCAACRRYRDELAEEEKTVRSGFEALARSLAPLEPTTVDQRHDQPESCTDVSNHHYFERVRKMIVAHKRLSLAAVAAMMGFLLLWGTLVAKPASAMEKMAETIRRAKSLKVTMSTECKFVREPGKPPVTATIAQTMYWLAPGSFRMDVKGGEFTAGMNHTDVFSAGSPGIHIEHDSKKFQHMPARRGPVPPFLMLDKLGTFSGKADRDLGAKEINGRKAWGFEIDGKKIDSDSFPGPVEIWLDTQSNLPVLLSYEMKSPAGPAMMLKMEDFHWNIELDRKLFSVEPPAGYTEEKRSEAEFPKTEKVVQEITLALRTYAELCGGRYPNVTRMFAEPVRDEMYKAAGIAYPGTPEQMLHDKQYRRVFDAGQGFAVFNRVFRYNPDVAYYGKTVGPNDKDKVLLRWKLDDGRYQVIFGDLRNEIVTAERLRDLEGK